MFYSIITTLNILGTDFQIKMNSIVFCTDAGYAQHIAPVIYSLLFNTKQETQFFIVCSQINNRDRTAIVNLTDKWHSHANFINFDTESAVKKYCKDIKPFRGGYDCYTRLFLPQILKQYNVEKCIYLDPDTIIKAPFDSIWQEAEKTDFLSGVYDPTSQKIIKDKNGDSFINSGMLIMNLPALDKIDFPGKCLDYAIKHPDEILFDQDLIDAVMSESYIRLIDAKYNEYRSKTALVKKGILLHFTGPFKPWMSSCRWRLKKCFWFTYFVMYKMNIKGTSAGHAIAHMLMLTLSILRPVLNLILEIKKSSGMLNKQPLQNTKK